MQRRFVVSDIEKCTGCKICEYVCSAVKEKGFNPSLSRIRTVRIEPTYNIAIACRLCEGPPCVAACPEKALSREEKTGIIRVKEDKCNGCGWCIEACEFGAIMLHPVKKGVVVCDLCDGDPKCVSYCPRGALSLLASEEISQEARKKKYRTRIIATGAHESIKLGIEDEKLEGVVHASDHLEEFDQGKKVKLGKRVMEAIAAGKGAAVSIYRYLRGKSD
jgi:carbon-monoxide dehydrogenase iron sulfur subunit